MQLGAGVVSSRGLTSSATRLPQRGHGRLLAPTSLRRPVLPRMRAGTGTNDSKEALDPRPPCRTTQLLSYGRFILVSGALAASLLLDRRPAHAAAISPEPQVAAVQEAPRKAGLLGRVRSAVAAPVSALDRLLFPDEPIAFVQVASQQLPAPPPATPAAAAVETPEPLVPEPAPAPAPAAAVPAAVATAAPAALEALPAAAPDAAPDAAGRLASWLVESAVMYAPGWPAESVALSGLAAGHSSSTSASEARRLVCGCYAAAALLVAAVALQMAASIPGASSPSSGAGAADDAEQPSPDAAEPPPASPTQGATELQGKQVAGPFCLLPHSHPARQHHPASTTSSHASGPAQAAAAAAAEALEEAAVAAHATAAEQPSPCPPWTPEQAAARADAVLQVAVAAAAAEEGTGGCAQDDERPLFSVALGPAPAPADLCVEAGLAAEAVREALVAEAAAAAACVAAERAHDAALAIEHALAAPHPAVLEAAAGGDATDTAPSLAAAPQALDEATVSELAAEAKAAEAAAAMAAIRQAVFNSQAGPDAAPCCELTNRSKLVAEAKAAEAAAEAAAAEAAAAEALAAEATAEALAAEAAAAEAARRSELQQLELVIQEAVAAEAAAAAAGAAEVAAAAALSAEEAAGDAAECMKDLICCGPGHGSPSQQHEQEAVHGPAAAVSWVLAAEPDAAEQQLTLLAAASGHPAITTTNSSGGSEAATAPQAEGTATLAAAAAASADADRDAFKDEFAASCDAPLSADAAAPARPAPASSSGASLADKIALQQMRDAGATAVEQMHRRVLSMYSRPPARQPQAQAPAAGMAAAATTATHRTPGAHSSAGSGSPVRPAGGAAAAQLGVSDLALALALAALDADTASSTAPPANTQEPQQLPEQLPAQPQAGEEMEEGAGRYVKKQPAATGADRSHQALGVFEVPIQLEAATDPYVAVSQLLTGQQGGSAFDVTVQVEGSAASSSSSPAVVQPAAAERPFKGFGRSTARVARRRGTASSSPSPSPPSGRVALARPAGWGPAPAATGSPQQPASEREVVVEWQPQPGGEPNTSAAMTAARPAAAPEDGAPAGRRGAGPLVAPYNSNASFSSMVDGLLATEDPDVAQLLASAASRLDREVAAAYAAPQTSASSADDSPEPPASAAWPAGMSQLESELESELAGLLAGTTGAAQPDQDLAAAYATPALPLPPRLAKAAAGNQAVAPAPATDDDAAAKPDSEPSPGKVHGRQAGPAA